MAAKKATDTKPRRRRRAQPAIGIGILIMAVVVWWYLLQDPPKAVKDAAKKQKTTPAVLAGLAAAAYWAFGKPKRAWLPFLIVPVVLGGVSYLRKSQDAKHITGTQGDGTLEGV